jgi:hypothetical protein
MQVKREQDRALSELHQQPQPFKASPLPLATAEPRYERQRAQQAQRRAEAHEARRRQLLEQQRPFGMEQREAERRRWQQVLHGGEASLGSPAALPAAAKDAAVGSPGAAQPAVTDHSRPSTPSMLHARPVPVSTTEARYALLVAELQLHSRHSRTGPCRLLASPPVRKGLSTAPAARADRLAMLAALRRPGSTASAGRPASAHSRFVAACISGPSFGIDICLQGTADGLPSGTHVRQLQQPKAPVGKAEVGMAEPAAGAEQTGVARLAACENNNSSRLADSRAAVAPTGIQTPPGHGSCAGLPSTAAEQQLANAGMPHQLTALAPESLETSPTAEPSSCSLPGQPSDPKPASMPVDSYGAAAPPQGHFARRSCAEAVAVGRTRKVCGSPSTQHRSLERPSSAPASSAGYGTLQTAASLAALRAASPAAGVAVPLCLLPSPAGRPPLSPAALGGCVCAELAPDEAAVSLQQPAEQEPSGDMRSL